MQNRMVHYPFPVSRHSQKKFRLQRRLLLLKKLETSKLRKLAWMQHTFVHRPLQVPDDGDSDELDRYSFNDTAPRREHKFDRVFPDHCGEIICNCERDFHQLDDQSKKDLAQYFHERGHAKSVLKNSPYLCICRYGCEVPGLQLYKKNKRPGMRARIARWAAAATQLLKRLCTEN